MDLSTARRPLAILPCALALLLAPACGDSGEPGDTEESSDTDAMTDGEATDGVGMSTGEATEDPTEDLTEDPTEKRQ